MLITKHLSLEATKKLKIRRLIAGEVIAAYRKNQGIFGVKPTRGSDFIRRTLMSLLVLLTLFALPPVRSFPQEAEPDPVEDNVNDEDFFDFGQNKEITVTGTQDATQQIVVIEKETIERRNAPDLATLLEEELDMSITRFGAYGNQTEINMRGFDTERIAILIDGVPANSPRSGDFDVSRIDLSNVERIEVIYGGSDTKYNVSGALGGVINIITVKKQTPGLHLGATVSNTGYLPGKYNKRHSGGAIGEMEPIDLLDMQSLSFSAGYGAEKFSWKASLFGNRAGNHYLYRDDYGFARRKISNEVLDIGGNAALVWDIGEYSSLLADTKVYYAHKNFPITMNSTSSALARDLEITENILFNAPVMFRSDLATEASLTYQFSTTEYGDSYSITRDHYLTGINRWNWYASERLTLRTGIDWRSLFIKSESPTETEPQKTGHIGGLYLTGEFSPFKRLMFIGSIKGVTDTKQAKPVPKIGVRITATDSLVIKHNWFRSFKFPDFDDLYYRSLDSMFVGNPDLRPEDGWGTDLMVEWSPKISSRFTFSLSSAVYGQYTEDSIHWIKSAGGRWSPENVGVAWFTGFDLRPKATIPLNRGGLTSLTLGFNYQYQMSWLLSGDLSFANSFRIPYMPTHIIGGTVDLAWKTGSLLVSAHYETTRYADTMNQMVLDPHCTVHVTVNQNLGKKLTLFGSLRNILNAQYESFASYYMPGISLALGIRMKMDAGK